MKLLPETVPASITAQQNAEMLMNPEPDPLCGDIDCHLPMPHRESDHHVLD